MGICLIQELKKKRADSELSQEKIARMLKVSLRTYQRWEKKETIPKSELMKEHIKKILEIL